MWKKNPKNRLSDDIALLELADEAMYDNYIKPACLPMEDIPVGSYCYITGEVFFPFKRCC